MAIAPKYWAYVDKGHGWEKVRQYNGDGWAFALTYLQLNKLRAQAKIRKWGFRSQVIPTHKPKRQPNVYPNETHITHHYTWAEAACHDGTPVPDSLKPNAVKLARGLEQMRDILGGPLPVISWYRTPEYNKKIHGAKNSQHLYAKAADMDPPQYSQAQLVEAAEQVKVFREGGIGVYPSGSVHVDVRGYKARWNSFVGQ